MTMSFERSCALRITCSIALLASLGACGREGVENAPKAEAPIATSSVALAPKPTVEETPEATEARRSAARARLDALKKKRRALSAAAAWESAESARKQQHFKEAMEAYQVLALHHPADPRAREAAEQAAFSAMRLNSYSEALQWVEDARELFHGTLDEARLLRVLGNLYIAIPHWGTRRGGELIRGRYDQGIYQLTYGLDRAIAIRHLEEARDLFSSSAEARMEERLAAELDLVGALARFTPYDSAWSSWYYAWSEAKDDDLVEQEGADEIGDRWGGWSSALQRSQPKGMPVDLNGKVVFTPRPQKYVRRLTDLAKIKFLLHEVEALDPTPSKDLAATALHRQALIFLARDGSQRLQRLSGWWWNGTNPYKADIESKKIYALEDDEVLGLIATHIGVYKVPDDENALHLFERIVTEYPKAKVAERARLSIATFFQSRQQYARAIAEYEKYLAEYPKGELRAEALGSKALLEQPELKIDGSQAQASGAPATFVLEHRNLTHLFARAMPLDTQKVVADFESEWKKSGYNGGASSLYPGSLPNMFLNGDQGAKRYYRGRWSEFELDVPNDGTHRYQKTELKVPIADEGLWLVEIYRDSAKKTALSRALLMLESTAIVRKAGLDSDLLWVVDARTGAPVRRASVHVFEFWDEWKSGEKTPVHHHRAIDMMTDDEGLARLRGLSQQYLVTVRTSDRFAYVSDAYHWGYSPSVREEGRLGFVFTDRPVYKPLDTVRIAAWVRVREKGRYVEAGGVKAIAIAINDAKGARVFEKTVEASANGGASFAFELPEAAALGAYTVLLNADGNWAETPGGTFRVEEYKTPELEVSVEAGDGPAKLGGRIPVKIRADYYFGGPVAGAKVKYRVFRQDHDEAWVAPGRWDWLYGRGYGRAYYAYPWFPWWAEWGWRPWCWYPWWGPRPSEAKELVREAEGLLSRDGTLAFEIDTASAKAAYGDRDQELTVEADVTDSSRRTITGRGAVLATRHQFAIHAETDRGYYETGGTIHLDVTSLLPGGQAIATSGEVRIALVSLRGDDGDTVEEAAIVAKPAKTDAAGKLSFDFDAKKEGQYRLSYVARDAWGEDVVGTTLVWVWGPGFDGRRFKFNHLELVSDKRTYSVGETAKLLISSDVANAHVLFSPRVDNGHLLEPRVIALSGKTKVVSIPIEAGHVPNFFVEATLAAGGKVAEEVREMFVPPKGADMNVEIRPKKAEYGAGKDAELEIATSDFEGRPIAAEVAVSVFDKSVLYIQSETTPDIRKHFWGRTRTHALVSATNLRRSYESWQGLAQPDQQAAWAFASAQNESMQGALDLSGLEKDRGEVALGGAEAKSEAAARHAASPSLALQSAEEARAEAPSASLQRDRYDKAKVGGKGSTQASDAPSPAIEPEVRRSFADTALWRIVKTDAKGHATIAFKFPDNLTTWRARAIGLAADTRAGEGTASIVTTKKLLVRLEAPRFFRERDRLLISAIVHNRLARKKTVKVDLAVSDPLLRIEGPSSKEIEVPKDGEVRADWWVNVSGEGRAKVKVAALTDEESDAKEQTFPVLVHGFLKMDSKVGSISANAPADAEQTLALRIPAERRLDQGELVVRWSPTLAGAMIDALPYLLDYPYGCTEQTMSRFVPAAITRRTLQVAGGWSLEDLEKIRKSSNPQELTRGPNPEKEHAARLEREQKRFDRNPVYDSKLMDDMIRTGLARISKMQQSSGGWGWWGSDRADVYTTSYVLFGLAEARDADVAIPPDLIERGVRAMEQMIPEHLAHYEDHEWVSDTDAYFAYVMSLFRRENALLDKYLLDRRGRLSVYGKSLLALALWNLNRKDDARLVLRNAEQFLKEDPENETAWIDTNTRWWWYWWNDDIESNAFFLRALVAIRPTDPRAPMIVKWLLNHRKHGYYWSSTRDSAVTISAFAHYLRSTKENEPDNDLEVSLDGKIEKRVHLDRKNLLSYDGELRIPAKDLASGVHELKIRRIGKGPVYFNAYLSYFTQEEDPPPSGLEIKIDRAYFKLVRKERVHEVFDQRGQATTMNEAAFEKLPLKSGDRVKSGDLILVELMIESKNDYAFLAFEDPKPAGMEPVALKSGTTYGEAVANLELRNEKVVFFLSALNQGKLKLDYRLRAEIPGVFHAMPAVGFGMYAPELSSSSREMRVTIEE
jgi:alpha-2-macroglobulin